MYYFIVVLFFIHLFFSFISATIFLPDTNPKGKTSYQIEEARKYSYLFRKNFPFLYYFSIIFILIPFIYFIYYTASSEIDFVASINILPLFVIAFFSIIMMFILYLFVNNEYDSMSLEMRKKCPDKLFFIAFIYFVSILNSTALVHYLNYRLDYSSKKEYIVDVTDSRYYTTRTSKGGTKHHYEIAFTPSVGGRSELEVQPELQYRTQIGDKLKMFLKKGAFGLPYICSEKIVIKKEELEKQDHIDD